MENKLVVGSQARILYSDQAGRSRIAAAFNKAVASREISAPVVSMRRSKPCQRALVMSKNNAYNMQIRISE